MRDLQHVLERFSRSQQPRERLSGWLGGGMSGDGSCAMYYLKARTDRQSWTSWESMMWGQGEERQIPLKDGEFLAQKEIDGRDVPNVLTCFTALVL